MASKLCFESLDEQALRELIHNIMELCQSKFGNPSVDKLQKCDFVEPAKTAKKRRTDSSAADSQPIATQNRFELLSENEEEAEDMEENEDTDKPGKMKTDQPSTSGRNKCKEATPRKSEGKRKVAPIIIKETAKWTRIANLMREKKITATKSKLISTGIQVEPALEEDYRKLSKLLKEQKTQFYTYQPKSEKKLRWYCVVSLTTSPTMK
ncbi:hypothetical protein Trydic_g8437 [Trypoxylus dichotomus]